MALQWLFSLLLVCFFSNPKKLSVLILSFFVTDLAVFLQKEVFVPSGNTGGNVKGQQQHVMFIMCLMSFGFRPFLSLLDS